ncbi:hypothetical protein V5N11_025646 [Cardamine amara subsp. amara]|uniref:Uncharacterized protein n=1 Tax=Cardamine amara subsp. amara TaxID=228776 RepID=A0ABD0ZPP3_CARAN
MASPNLYTKRRSSPNAVPPSVSPTQPRSKSTGGGFFCKSVLFALFLLALPLFPSQAPDFVGKTVLTKFWELIHLLFVGIAVAYGLFSRRNVESSVDLRMSRVDESSLSYVSRIFQVTSVFDEEFESSCEFDDVRNENVSARASSVVGKSESFVVESKVEESSEYGKTNEVRAWNSQYFQGRSKVVVARPAYGLDGHVVHQPLGLPVRSLRSALRDNVAHEDDNSSADSSDEAVNEKAESLADEVLAAPSSPVVPWLFRPEMMGMGDHYPSDFHPQSVDETQFGTLKSTTSSSSSSSSSHSSFASQSQNKFSPSRSVSQESLNSNVEELVKEKSLQSSSSRSSSPSLPPSPSLPLSPPSPELVTDDTHRSLPELVTYDTHRRASHSRHYSDGSLLEEDVRKGFEDELEGNKVKGRRTEVFSKKERGSKSLKLAAESSRRRNKSRRSYPPESISSPIGGTDDSTTRRRDIHQKSDTHLIEDNIRKGLKADHNNLRVKKGRSYDSLELSAEDEKINEPVPTVDVMFQPMNAKASRRAMHSSRGGRATLPEKDVTRNLEDDDTEDSDKSRKRELPSNNNKELKSNSPRLEPRSWRASSNVSSSLRGKSVRTIRSDRHGKDVKTDGDSSDDRTEAKVESRGRTKSRRERQEELSIVLHQEKSSETRAKLEPEDHVMEETEAEAEQQPQVTLEEEEEEEAAWESQSNASHDHNEVDRKAGEFIAKFREQIRLQKLISGEQPRGGGGGTGIIRNSHSHFR